MYALGLRFQREFQPLSLRNGQADAILTSRDITLTITYVTDSTGFFTAEYFSATFKLRFGLPL